MTRPAASGGATDGEREEQSIDLTPGVVWTEAQLVVVRRLSARAMKAEMLLDRLAEDADDVPCRYDHHGACQEHGGGSEEPGVCSDRAAHELLKRLGLR